MPEQDAKKYPCPRCNGDNTWISNETNAIIDLTCVDCNHCWEVIK